MTFKGYENSECPHALCLKGCNHSLARNCASSNTKPSTDNRENITNPLRDVVSQSSRRSTTETDGAAEFYSSKHPTRIQSCITSLRTSPSPEKQETRQGCIKCVSLTPLTVGRERDKYRTAVYQPSLAAGGPVDLTKSFTPTAHGTFSFGGQPNKVLRGGDRTTQ
jgi:hypothetical protein